MVDQAIERTIREGVPWDFDTRIVRPDGSTAVVQSKGVRQLDAAGTPVRLVGTAQDISERKAAEVALHQNEERLRLAFGAGGLGIWECDLVTNQVYLSPEVEAQFGIAPGTFAGTLDALLERVHVDDRARFGQALAKSMANGHDLVLEFRSIATDGTVGWLAGQAQLFRDATGRPVRLLGICRDVSERKAAEAVLRKTEVQLQQAQKMEAVGMLAGGIAHDFNNLLTAIIGFSELALGDLPEDSSVRPMIGEVTRAGERASVLTRQLLAFSRQQVMQPAVLDLNAVASDMERMLTRVIGEDIDLATVKAGDLGHVFIDPSQVEQIIMNLAVNARDAMPSGGKLTIMTANVNVFPDASVASELPAGRYVLLAVSDTGNGMDAATQARIFEPFFTTKELGKGTGLGLATVYGIVKQNESEIRVYSEPGQGTTFKVYFPRMVEEASGPHNVEETVFELACGGTETILLVEDEAVVRALALQVLESAGYTVLVAMTGEAGADIVAEYAGSIDLLLTDVVMPGGGGVELARRITEIRPRTHVLFMSGYPGEIAVRHGMLALADAYLGKPFTPHALRQKVRDVLDGAPAARELAAAPLF
jgi:PAS domain S-box-containing protein